jgi:hypothetical protein
MMRVSSIKGREGFFEVSYVSLFLDNLSAIFPLYFLRSLVYLFSPIGISFSSLLEPLMKD